MKHIAFISLLALTPQINSEHVITFFIKRYPTAEQKLTLQHAKRLDKSATAKQTLKLPQRGLPGYFGIFATYGGYLNLSDRIGQITFPLKHQAPFIDLIVTKQIVPVTKMNKIIDHWEVPPGEESAVYHIQRREDPETKLSYLDISKKDSPSDGILPLRSIIIFADPQAVYVPLGVVLTQKNANMLLPTIYIRPKFPFVESATEALAIRKFFETPQLLYQMIPYGYAQQWFALN